MRPCDMVVIYMHFTSVLAVFLIQLGDLELADVDCQMKPGLGEVGIRAHIHNVTSASISLSHCARHCRSCIWSVVCGAQ